MRNLLVVIGMTLVALVAGCRSEPVNTVPDERIVYRGFPEGRLHVIDLRTGRNDANLATAEVRVINWPTGFWTPLGIAINREESAYMVDYKFSWFDASGVEVTPRTEGWRNILILPGPTVETLSSVAPDPSCVRFQLTFKEGLPYHDGR